MIAATVITAMAIHRRLARFGEVDAVVFGESMIVGISPEISGGVDKLTPSRIISAWVGGVFRLLLLRECEFDRLCIVVS